MIDMLCMIDTRNFFLKRNFCTEVCHVKVCLKNTLSTSKLLIVAICCATNSFMVEFVCIQKSSTFSNHDFRKLRFSNPFNSHSTSCNEQVIVANKSQHISNITVGHIAVLRFW